MAEPFVKKTYFGLTLDPLHVGTGGYRLGRVDLTICREPATRIPKVPGSSVAGVARAYTAMAIQSEDSEKKKYRNPQPLNGDSQNGFLSCAGKGVNDGDGHCGTPDCEVCTAYGFSRKTSSFQGLAQFSDARILFFPVPSSHGPIWVTSPSSMFSAGQSGLEVGDDKFKKIVATNQTEPALPERLNFGWLMLSSDGTAISDITASDQFGALQQMLKGKLYLVSDRLFSRIVNDNLEVRTSVAINPATGAAEDKALYTYEAIPRATLLFFDVVYNRPEYFNINVSGEYKDIVHGKPAGEGWKWISENVEKGFRLIQFLGMGGMNTRGMGRLKILNCGG